MTRIELTSRAGPDGVVTLSVPLGPDGANREVRVTVQPVDSDSATEEQREAWRRFIEQTEGSITDPTFRRHDQGEYEERDPLP